MTQDDLAAASGYSRSLIGALERNDRLPDVEAVIRVYLPALGLQEEPLLAARLVELAAIARGERPLASLPLQLEGRMPIPTEDAGRAHCLPLPPTEILGRDDEISQICDRLLGRQARLMTLVGPPGVGKTRLALAVGMELQRFYRDGACFIPLAAVSDPALVASTLASALALLDDSAKPPQTRLIEHLRRKEMLLVLDSYEQLTSVSSPAVAVVAGLLTECPDLRILVTSRERLHLRAEQRYRVQPLALEAAVNLFAQRAVAVEGEFVLTTANRPIIEAICHQVDRLPLALELCAAHMDLLSPSELLAGLCDRRLELLVDGAQDLPPYQRTLRSAIGHSYDLLDEVERALFRSLGVFAGGCRLEAIEAVNASNERLSGHSLTSTLHGLINKSLVRAEDTPDGATRYVQMETIREYALEQAQAEGEEHLLRERHSATYLQLFRVGDGGLRGPEATAWLARLEPEQDNLRTALRWTHDEGRYADMEWLLIAVNWFWHHTGNQAESYGWHRLLLPHRATLDVRLRLALLISLHFLARTSEESRAIAPYTSEMMDLLEVCPEKTLQASAWRSCALHGEDPAEATAALEQAVASARAALDEPALGPEFGILADRDFILGDNLWAYAIRLSEQGDFTRAALSLAESHQIFLGSWERAQNGG